MSQEAHVEEAEQTKARQVRETAVAYVRLKRHLCCLKTPLLHLLRTPSVVYDAGHLGCMSQQQRARQFLPGLCLLWSCVPGWLPVCLCARVCMRVHTHTHTQVLAFLADHEIEWTRVTSGSEFMLQAALEQHGPLLVAMDLGDHTTICIYAYIY